MGLRPRWMVAAASVGVFATAATAARFADGHGRTVQALVSRPWSMAGGAIGGIVFAFLIWALCSPRNRVTKAAGVLVILNGLAWSIFLVANPRVGDGGASIVERRAEMDAALASPTRGTPFAEEPGFLIAGREVTWIDLSQKPLGLFAGPAVVFVHGLLVPERYLVQGPTVSQSYWIAGAGFVLSTAWWVTAGTVGIRLLLSRSRLRARSSPPVP